MENFEIKTTSFWKRAAVLAAGFGVGGAIWGLEAYRGTVGSGEVFTNPFSYILGAVSLAVFGGLVLAYLSQINGSTPLSRLFLSKNTMKIVGLGLVGWLVAFLLPAVWLNKLLFIGLLILSFILSPFEASGSLGQFLPNYLRLDPSLNVGILFVEFLFAGLIIGLVYSLILKTKIIRMMLWAAGGFALAALIGPILGNLIGNLFGALIVNYTLTFVIICVIFGVSLAVGMRGKQTETLGVT